jgi:hypothetical protein
MGSATAQGLDVANTGQVADADTGSDIRCVDVDRLVRRFRLVYPLKIFLENVRQLVAASAIGLVLGATGFFVHYAIVLRSGSASAPIEIQVFLVTAFASFVVIGYVSLWAATVRNFLRLGGLLTLAIALFMSWSLLDSGSEIADPIADLISALMTITPLDAGLLLAIVGFALAYYAHLIWGLAQAAFALALVNASDRKFMRDLPARQAAMSMFSRYWGFPPLFKFVRGSSARFGAITVLSLFCALLFSIVTALPLLLTVPLEDIAGIGEKCGTEPSCAAEEVPHALSDLVYPFGFVLVCVVVGWISQRLLQRLLRFSLETLQEIDSRPPVLFLRAFRDDQVPLRVPKLALFGRLLEIGRRSNTLDRLLLEEATPYGPVVGLGSPADKRPPYGAARGYFGNQTWQEAVANLAAISVFTVICVDDTAGVWWEVEHLIDRQHLSKTLFLIHPRYAGEQENAAILERTARHFRDVRGGEALRASPPQRPGRSRRPAVIGFFRDQDGFHILQTSDFSRFAYLMTLRVFMRGRLGAA